LGDLIKLTVPELNSPHFDLVVEHDIAFRTLGVARLQQRVPNQSIRKINQIYYARTNLPEIYYAPTKFKG
jgi:hypothetical protein